MINSSPQDNTFCKSIIVVLGMHRSGTSALTRGLHSLSASLGENLLQAVKGDNEKGFWEDVDLYRINERILAKLGSNWQALSVIDEGELLGTALDEEREDALSILRNRLQNVDVFAFKDPRTANVLPFWQSIFSDLNLDDRYLISVRNPRSVADSLFRRNQIARQKSYCLWMKHQLNAIHYSQGRPRIVVDYDLLLDAPGTQLKRMAEALNLSMPALDSSQYRDYAETFLSDDLRHHKYAKRLDREEGFPGFIASCYQLLQDMAEDKLDDHKVLQDPRYQLSQSEFLYYPSLFKFIDDQCQDLTDSQHHNKALQVDNERLVIKNTTLYNSLERYKKTTENFNELRRRLDESKQNLLSYKELAKKKNADTTLLNQKLLAAKERSESYRDVLNKRDLTIKSLNDKLRSTQQDFQKVKALAERECQEKQRLRQQFRMLNNKVKLMQTSASWRVTKPMRYAGYKMKQIMKITAPSLTGAMRWVWRKWPGSNKSRQQLVEILFSKAPFLVSHTRTYQLWCQSNNKVNKKPVTSPRSVSSSSNLPDRVVISCWLAVEDPIIDGLVDIARQLNSFGLTSEFYGTARFFQERGEHHTHALPLLLSTSNYSVMNKADSSLPIWIKDIYRVEMNWCNGNSSLNESEVREKCNLAYFYWLDQFITNRPVYVLVWGASAPLSRLHILLCNTLMIPYLVLERGHFQSTLLVDSSGHGISSEKLIRPADIAPRTTEIASGKRGRRDEILAWERSVGEKVPYSDANSAISTGLLNKIQKSNKKIILYIGANDLGSGCARSPEDPLRCSFLFDDSFSAVEYLKSMMDTLFPDCVLLVKPHPSDRRNYYDLKSENLMVVDGLNINQLIKLSDVCVSTSTTAFAKCIVENKPILALATSDISFKNIAYEPRELSSLPVMLRAAIDKDGFGAKVDSGLAFLEELFDNNLIALDGKAPARLKIEDVSNLIYQRYLISASQNYKKVISHTYSDKAFEQASVDVIIPVYGNVEATKNCIESVISSRKILSYRLIVINDASPVTGMEAMLNEFASAEGVEFVTNGTNLGFVGTVNRGMALSDARDVILLNSDTLVTPGWVDRLSFHAYSSSDVATVTPFSNNASIFSVRNFPEGFDLSEEHNIRELDDGLVFANGGKSIDVPVGHGFCIFIRRTCINRVGYFDQLAFGRGYSEEVDFCQRASKLGFRHLCATDTFVAHVGGLSFSDTGNEQRMINRKIIQERYPDYFKNIKQFIKDDPLEKFRVL